MTEVFTGIWNSTDCPNFKERIFTVWQIDLKEKNARYHVRTLETIDLSRNSSLSWLDKVLLEYIQV